MKKENKSLEELLALPEYEAVFTLEDMISVNDYRASETIKIRYADDVDGVIRNAEKCGVSEDRIALYGLSLGLKSIAGEKVDDDNIQALLIKHLKVLPTDIIRLYNDMVKNALKKKS